MLDNSSFFHSHLLLHLAHLLADRARDILARLLHLLSRSASAAAALETALGPMHMLRLVRGRVHGVGVVELAAVSS